MTHEFCIHYRQNSETFDVLHAFLSLVVAKVSDLKNSPVFWPTLHMYVDVFVITRHSLVERRARYLFYCMFVCLCLPCVALP